MTIDKQTRAAALLVSLMLLGSCQRLAEETPQWLFDTYSSVPIDVSGSGSVRRYEITEDHRVIIELDSDCSNTSTSWELTWERLSPNELVLEPLPESAPFPGSDLYSKWILVYSSECEPLQLDTVSANDGDRNHFVDLYRGAVCSAPVPPPDDWTGTDWDECEWFWCDAPPVSNCDPDS